MLFRRLPGLGIMSGERSPAIYRRKPSQTDSDNLFVTVGRTGSFVAEQLGHSVQVGIARLGGSRAAGRRRATAGMHARPTDRSLPFSDKGPLLHFPVHSLARSPATSA